MSRILHFLVVTGRLFHKVAAAVLKHILPNVTPCVVGTVNNVQTVETLSAHTERQVPLSLLKCLKSVHQNHLLRPVYKRKPMQGVQDWCYMFSFMSASD